jgi:predicted ATPase
MITSVKFPVEGNGYLYEKYEKPEKPDKNDRRSRTSYDERMKEYNEELAVYEANKGKFILPASYNLIGKEFSFKDGKINVLFGPNASGKTTVLRTIAGECLTEDGFTSLRKPIEFGFLAEKYDISKIVGDLKKNTAFVQWDGAPLYYDNFGWRKEQSYGMFGGLVGSAIGSLGEEIEYHLVSHKTSAGQNAVYILNKILRIASQKISLKEICERQYESNFANCNSTWKKCGEAQLECLSKLPRYEDETYPTLMFDEIDKSLDIETVWTMYSEFFPALAKKYGCQIILVSHNPLILSEPIMENDVYNIISLDEAYTNDVKGLLKGVRF